MSTNSNRIKALEQEIQRCKYIQETNAKTIEKIGENLKVFIGNLNEDSKAYVVNYFPQLLQEGFIDSLKELSYDALMGVRDKLLTLQNAILDDVESGLS